MANALDAFRAQREAVEQLNASVKELCALVAQARGQVDGLSLNADLKAVLQDEQAWLERARTMVAEVRHWREHEIRRFWFAVFWRWTLACGFALVAAWVAGAGYASTTRPYAQELERLRPKAELSDMIERRLNDLTPAQHREFDKLMKPSGDSKR